MTAGGASVTVCGPFLSGVRAFAPPMSTSPLNPKSGGSSSPPLLHKVSEGASKRRIGNSNVIIYIRIGIF